MQYFVCKKWAEMKNNERYEILKSKGLCCQCLFPGAEISKGKHATGQCQRDFVCQHSSHDKFTTKKHVLVCEEHKDTQENKDTLERFKLRCILKRNLSDLPTHAKEIGFVNYVGSLVYEPHEEKLDEEVQPDEVSQLEVAVDNQSSDNQTTDINSTDVNSTIDVAGSTNQANYVGDKVNCYTHPSEFIDSVDDEGVFMLQTIQAYNETFNLFYDSGCGALLSRFLAIQRLREHAIQ